MDKIRQVIRLRQIGARSFQHPFLIGTCNCAETLWTNPAQVHRLRGWVSAAWEPAPYFALTEDNGPHHACMCLGPDMTASTHFLSKLLYVVSPEAACCSFLCCRRPAPPSPSRFSSSRVVRKEFKEIPLRGGGEHLRQFASDQRSFREEHTRQSGFFVPFDLILPLRTCLQ